MAHKKSTRGKARRASGSRSAALGRKRRTVAVDAKCNVPNLCAYFSSLSAWLMVLNVDYTALRIAVCNVEKQAFSGTGVDAKPPRFCSGLPNEPAPPSPFS